MSIIKKPKLLSNKLPVIILPSLNLSQTEELMKNIPNTQDVPLGEKTNFVCHCGGTMHRFDPIGHQVKQRIQACGKPRYSKKKRYQKKFAKQWSNRNSATLILASVLPLRHPMGFRCAKCGHTEGFYSMMAKFMFHIEPMTGSASTWLK